MKKLLLALLMAGVLGGAVYGAAAALTVTGGTLQSGNVSATCDPTGVSVDFTSTDLDPLDVEDVTVNGIEAACINATLTVTVNPSQGSCTVVILGASATCTLSGTGAVIATATSTDVTIVS